MIVNWFTTPLTRVLFQKFRAELGFRIDWHLSTFWQMGSALKLTVKICRNCERAGRRLSGNSFVDSWNTACHWLGPDIFHLNIELKMIFFMCCCWGYSQWALICSQTWHVEHSRFSVSILAITSLRHTWLHLSAQVKTNGCDIDLPLYMHSFIHSGILHICTASHYLLGIYEDPISRAIEIGKTKSTCDSYTCVH